MDLQEKHYLCESNQAFCNIYGEILCLSMFCTWQRTFYKRLEKRYKAVNGSHSPPRRFMPIRFVTIPLRPLKPRRMFTGRL